MLNLVPIFFIFLLSLLGPACVWQMRLLARSASPMHQHCLQPDIVHTLFHTKHNITVTLAMQYPALTTSSEPKPSRNSGLFWVVTIQVERTWFIKYWRYPRVLCRTTGFFHSWLISIPNIRKLQYYILEILRLCFFKFADVRLNVVPQQTMCRISANLHSSDFVSRFFTLWPPLTSVGLCPPTLKGSCTYYDWYA